MNNILHRASKVIVKIKEKVKPVIEKLTDIREKIWYGRRMNRRLHSIPFRKVQSYITYKGWSRDLSRSLLTLKMHLGRARCVAK